MQVGGNTAAQEWKAHWPLVLSAMMGLSFGALPTASLGLFMAPLKTEFGWSSSEVTLGISLLAISGMLLNPVAGAVLDRLGARRMVLPGLVLCGSIFAAFGLQTGEYAQWIGLWLLLGLGMLSLRMMIWNRAVSGAFTVGRGVALAVLLSGMSLTQAAVPALTHLLIESVGWRGAYVGLGGGFAGLAFLLVLFFFHEQAPAKSPRAGESPRPAVGGLTLREALRNPAVVKIAIATTLQTGVAAAITLHLVPLLVSSGLDRPTAAGAAAAFGLGALIGTLSSGWLVDRFSTAIVPFTVFSIPALAYYLLWQGKGSLPLLVTAIAIVGLTAGAANHMTNYLATRYVGLAHFGKVFGIIASLMGLAAAIGPLLAAMVFDSTGSYDRLLFAGMALAIVGGALVAALGPYPHFGRPAGAPV
jgi:MFS family permease